MNDDVIGNVCPARASTGSPEHEPAKIDDVDEESLLDDRYAVSACKNCGAFYIIVKVPAAATGESA